MMSDYLGYRKINFSDDELAQIYSSRKVDGYEFLENEYVVAIDGEGKVVDKFCWQNGVLRPIKYYTIRTQNGGPVKARNLEQELFMDLLHDESVGAKVVCGPFGSGKAVDVDTILPTPDGNKRAGDIKEGDYLFARDGTPTKVIGVFPQGAKQKYKVSFQDGRVAYCCKDHLWSYYTSKGNLKTISVEEMLQKGIKQPSGGYRFRIPLTEPVEYQEKELEIDPYAMGHLCLERGQAIPKNYLYGSVEQRFALLRGLLDTNDFSKGKVHFTTTNPQLKDGVKQLVWSLGFLCSEFVDARMEDIYYDLHIEVPVEGARKASLTIRDIEPLEEETEMVCFYVDNAEHLFLMNDYIVTHNTMLCTSRAVEMLERDEIERVIFVRNNVQVKDTDALGALPGTELDKVLPYVMPFADHCGGIDALRLLIAAGRLEVIPLGFLRGRSIKNAVLYATECENLTKEHIQLMLGRVDSGSQLWLDGDIKQRDRAVFEKSQGIETMIERLKGDPHFGYIKLEKSERSDIARLADKLDNS